MQETNVRAYRLFWETGHLKNVEHDASLIRFDGFDRVAGLLHTRNLHLPEEIFFAADLGLINNSDFPVTDVNWPIMSKNMLNIVFPNGVVGCRAIEVVLFDRKFRPDHEMSISYLEKFGVEHLVYYAVQLLEFCDILDWSASEFLPHKRLPGRARTISSVVLKKDVAVPAIFRLTAKPSTLFVSSDTKKKLQSSGVKGVAFTQLDRVRV